MSTDFENELRDLFREKAEGAPLATPTLPASAPRQVLRRGRLHQVGTVLGSMAVVVALILGSVAGLTRILGEGPESIETADYEIFHRTATIEAFTVGSPSDWYLVNQWPMSMLIAVEGSGGSASSCIRPPSDEPQECNDTGEGTSSPIPVPHGLPMLQLSNVDLGLATNACEAGIPDRGAVLYVALDYDRAIAGVTDPTIGEFPPGGSGLPPTIEEGPCGPGRYAHFTVNGEPFFSWLATGSEVSDEDRETVETSYEMMSAIPDWTATPPDHTTPGYVIAGGTSTEDGPWRLEVRPGNDVEMALFVDGTTGRVDVSLGSEPVSWCCKQKTDPTRAGDVVFGAVQKDATAVVFRSDDERADIPGTIMPLPPTLPFGFDLFFIEGTADLVGDVVALGVDAEEDVSPPPVAEPRDEVVGLSGTFEGQPWMVRFTGAFADGTACIHVTVVDTYEPSCHERVENTFASSQPSSDSWVTDQLYLEVTSVVPEVVELRFVGDDDSIVPSQYRCAMGPLGWTDPDRKVCVIILPPNGSGTLEFLDTQGDVLFEQGMGWGAAEPEEPTPIPVDPVHGGTYWAVYPWVGAAGSREADDVSAELFAQFGIEAFPGDLTCDQGAAEALGTDAEQGIGVYFETDDEANAFALQAGLLDHTRRVIARVTTYCLD